MDQGLVCVDISIALISVHWQTNVVYDLPPVSVYAMFAPYLLSSGSQHRIKQGPL